MVCSARSGRRLRTTDRAGDQGRVPGRRLHFPARSVPCGSPERAAPRGTARAGRGNRLRRLTLRTDADSVPLRPRDGKPVLSRQGTNAERSPSRLRRGACPSFGSLKTEEKTNASAGDGRWPSGRSRRRLSISVAGFPTGHATRTKPAQAGESSRPDLNHPADRSTASTTDEIHVRDVGLSHKSP
jgi:hypothetical protein